MTRRNRRVLKPKSECVVCFENLGHRGEDVYLRSRDTLVRRPGLLALSGRTIQIVQHFGVEYPESNLRVTHASQSLERLEKLLAASSSSIGPAQASTFHTHTQA